ERDQLAVAESDENDVVPAYEERELRVDSGELEGGRGSERQRLRLCAGRGVVEIQRERPLDREMRAAQGDRASWGPLDGGNSPEPGAGRRENDHCPCGLDGHPPPADGGQRIRIRAALYDDGAARDDPDQSLVG